MAILTLWPMNLFFQFPRSTKVHESQTFLPSLNHYISGSRHPSSTWRSFLPKNQPKTTGLFWISPFSIGNTSTQSGSSHFSASYGSWSRNVTWISETNQPLSDIFKVTELMRSWSVAGCFTSCFWVSLETFPEMKQRNISVTRAVVMILCFWDGTCLISTSLFGRHSRFLVDFCSNQVWSWYLSDWNVSFGAVNGYPFFFSPSTCTSAVEKTCHVLTV